MSYNTHYITPMTPHYHANFLPSSGHGNNRSQPKAGKYCSSTSHFSLFSCCLSVVLSLEKGDYPKNVHVVFGPNKQHSV